MQLTCAGYVPSGPREQGTGSQRSNMDNLGGPPREGMQSCVLEKQTQGAECRSPLLAEPLLAPGGLGMQGIGVEESKMDFPGTLQLSTGLWAVGLGGMHAAQLC